jgi:dipeptidyl aminopeptidase/acylaminoacyl peptidase
MGWSQGGFISAFCTTYSDRFKAISVGGGITNWVTNYVNTDLPSFIRMHVGGTPWNDPEIYAKSSPMTYIQSACTPTLIQHGEKDARVPLVNANELYKGLRDMEVDTELIIFEGMGYSSEKPGIHRAIMKQNLMWFSHYILGESMDGFGVL